MDLYEDTHLCLRCGKTVEGLDNYVSHRQQQCYKFQQSSNSPFLSDASRSLTPSETAANDLQSDFPYDIYKLSANDFFLSLNLQSNFKTIDPNSCDIQKNLKENTDEGFCSRLEIPVEDSELVNVFSCDKQLCSDKIVDEHHYLDINNVALTSDKWDNFKIQNDLCETEPLCFVKDVVHSESRDMDELRTTDKVQLSESLKAKESFTTLQSVTDDKEFSKRSKKKILKQYSYSQFSILNVPRTSYRQKINANGSLMCCQGKQKYYTCSMCNLKFSFAYTFLNHLLTCSKNCCDTEKGREEIFKNESLFVRSLHFKCLLCSFFCGDSFVFLEHLRSPSHRQNAASLKNPLICLPCQDECSASDEIKEHFSKNHLQYNRKDHPIIVAEKKKNVHCCYCLTLIKSSSHLQEIGSKADALHQEDIDFAKCSLPVVSCCGYGVDKSMFTSYLSKTNSFIASTHSELSNEAISDVNDVSKEKCITAVLLEEPLKIKISKISLSKDDQSSIKDKEPTNNSDEATEGNRKRLIGKFTSQNGKFTYTKVKIKHSNRVLLCFQCGSKHVTKKSLQNHMDQCEDENKVCKKSLYMKKSKKTQFLCDKCPYIGRSFTQLTRHSRSHSGVKPFKCPHCDYTFALSSQLVRHARLHTGLKPYNCPYCSYSCNTQENLRKHILKTKKHKGKMMYPCQHCAYESNEFSTFRDHLLEDHPDQFPNGVTSLNSSVHGLALGCKN